ncbi:MAG TPA: cob(I)yrinic acid a,c-diamide adenosyltransferase [Planctomycetes bacterium]|nr:cob(I)yrinic acid a,c-diamide adenosyltransferase [Planctomycetota bacterium]
MRSAAWERGYVHLYTGDGKGKTSAALGLALRAAGAGLPVFIAQFAKARPSAERAALARLEPLVEVRCFGRPSFVVGAPAAEDIAAAREGLDHVRRVLAEGRHRVVILDEAATAAAAGLIDVEAVLALIDARPPGVELVVTGRDADARLIARADLVTEMRAVKHYFAAGVPAREGIEF